MLTIVGQGAIRRHMVRYVLTFTFLLSLTASWLAPERVALYRSCCSAENHVASCCEKHSTVPVLESSNNCCRPIIISLNQHQPMQAGNVVEQTIATECPALDNAFRIELPVVDLHSVVATLNTGPPCSTDSLLPLQSRFNL